MTAGQRRGRIRREGRRSRRRAAAQGGRAAQPRRPGRLRRHPAVPGDRPRGGRKRDRTCGRSTFSCSARCACWPATWSRWPPVRAKPWPARSPRPATRSPAARARHHHQRLPGPPRRRVDGPAAGGHGPDGRLDHRGSTAEERRAAYDCDVTYASVNEIGFDVLRDQLVTDVDDLVSPNPDVALIDEADSVLVDEALVPLVLAGTTHRETPRLEIIKLVGELTADDRLRHRLRQPQRPPHRGRRPQSREGARRHRPVLRGTRRHHAHRGQRRAARARAVAPRRALHRPRRRRAPDQLLPRPHRAAAALARRPAGRCRGQGRHRDHRDRRGARHHHGAGADQPLPDGVRNDGHRAGRRRAAAPVLQARRVTDSAEHPQHS